MGTNVGTKSKNMFLYFCNKAKFTTLAQQSVNSTIYHLSK
jgi:hypothetical protein